MSTEAKKAYFALTRALTRAAAAKALHTPHFPRDADQISDETLQLLRAQLRMVDTAAAVDTWEFGADLHGDTSAAARFRDYVLLQWRASILRSELSEDLGSRRRPGTDSR